MCSSAQWLVVPNRNTGPSNDNSPLALLRKQIHESLFTPLSDLDMVHSMATLLHNL
jgi:hypothetical protein